MHIKIIVTLIITMALSKEVFSEELYRFVIHDGKDPFTLPHTRQGGCAKWHRPWKGAKLCVSPTIQCQYMYATLAVVVDGPSEKDAKKEVDRCLSDSATSAALSGLVAGYASGGYAALTSALTTFDQSLKACVRESLKSSLTVRKDNPSHWGSWSGC